MLFYSNSIHLRLSIAAEKLNILRCIVGLLIVSSLTTATIGNATIINASENALLFGNLNQNSPGVNCGGVACGPTAAVNSFVYLEYTNPILGNELIPILANQTFYQDEINAANTLSTDDYMGTCSVCGTYISDFITGKQAYFQKMVTNVDYQFSAEIGVPWKPVINKDPMPSYVLQNTAPTADYIASQINENEDVEIFVNYNGDGNHYLTLTSIKFDTMTDTGSIGFIDPLTGSPGKADITGLDANGFIQTNYSGGARIIDAVSESIPEPATIVLMGLGFLGMGRFIGRWKLV